VEEICNLATMAMHGYAIPKTTQNTYESLQMVQEVGMYIRGKCKSISFPRRK